MCVITQSFFAVQQRFTKHTFPTYHVLQTFKQCIEIWMFSSSNWAKSKNMLHKIHHFWTDPLSTERRGSLNWNTLLVFVNMNFYEKFVVFSMFSMFSEIEIWNKLVSCVPCKIRIQNKQTDNLKNLVACNAASLENVASLTRASHLVLKGSIHVVYQQQTFILVIYFTNQIPLWNSCLVSASQCVFSLEYQKVFVTSGLRAGYFCSKKTLQHSGLVKNFAAFLIAWILEAICYLCFTCALFYRVETTAEL